MDKKNTPVVGESDGEKGLRFNSFKNRKILYSDATLNLRLFNVKQS